MQNIFYFIVSTGAQVQGVCVWEGDNRRISFIQVKKFCPSKFCPSKPLFV